jgi:hypothetical protein
LKHLLSNPKKRKTKTAYNSCLSSPDGQPLDIPERFPSWKCEDNVLLPVGLQDVQGTLLVGDQEAVTCDQEKNSLSY